MKTFEFSASQFLPRSREEIFKFFSDATNLESITPPWLSFHMLTPTPIEMREGALIDYRLRVNGIPFRWRTRISAWEPDDRFVDEQLRGPYRLWRHEHLFEDAEGGTRMRDCIQYAPLGGALVNGLFVRRNVERIFAYRAERMDSLFGTHTTPKARASSSPAMGGASLNQVSDPGSSLPS